MGHSPVLKCQLECSSLLSDHPWHPSGLRCRSLQKQHHTFNLTLCMHRLTGYLKSMLYMSERFLSYSTAVKLKLTKGLEEGFDKAGAVSVHWWVHVDVVCSGNWRRGKKEQKCTLTECLKKHQLRFLKFYPLNCNFGYVVPWLLSHNIYLKLGIDEYVFYQGWYRLSII